MEFCTRWVCSGGGPADRTGARAIDYVGQLLPGRPTPDLYAACWASTARRASRVLRAGQGAPRSSRSGRCRAPQTKRASRATGRTPWPARRWKSSRTCGGSSRCPIGNRTCGQPHVAFCRACCVRPPPRGKTGGPTGRADREACFLNLLWPCPSILRRHSTVVPDLESVALRETMPICCCCGTSWPDETKDLGGIAKLGTGRSPRAKATPTCRPDASRPRRAAGRPGNDRAGSASFIRKYSPAPCIRI